LAAAEAARRTKKIRNQALLAIVVVGIVVVVALVITSDRKQRSEEAAGFETGSCQFDRRSDADAGPGRNHVPNPTYEVDPPAGGDHTQQAAGPGLYTAANSPVDGQIVHAQEHGYVVLWHRPDLQEQDLTALRRLADRYQPNVLLVPRATIDTPVAATAWHVRLRCGSGQLDTLGRFISTFLDKGPESGFITDKTPREVP